MLDLAKLYGKLFARKSFRRLNYFLYRCAIHGLGCLHWENFRVSGEDAFVRSFVAGHDNPLIVFDVGAYHGDYGKMVRRYSQTADIYCFEPHPRSYERLRDVAQRHGLVALNLACAERSGKADLFDLAHADGSPFASLYREMFDLHLEKPWRSHEVDTVTLDEFARSRGIERINLLKIDTEGAELDVLARSTRADRGRAGRCSPVRIQQPLRAAAYIHARFLRDPRQLPVLSPAPERPVAARALQRGKLRALPLSAHCSPFG